jgi:hypothetical protein
MLELKCKYYVLVQIANRFSFRHSSDGLQLLTDINSAGGSDPQDLTVIGDLLYFTANDGDTRKLYSLDSSVSAVVPLTALSSEAADKILAYGDKIIFIQSDADMYVFYYRT